MVVRAALRRSLVRNPHGLTRRRPSSIFDGHTVRVRDLKGMHYLARLLADPGREYHVLDLVAACTLLHHCERCTGRCVIVHHVSNPDPEAAAHVAREVRRRRRQHGWTLDVAASRLGVSRRLLAQIEAGQANPSLSTLLSIAAGFDASLVDLLAGTDTPSITLQADNRAAPLLWSGDAGGEGRLLVGSDPLELWEWTLQPGDERRSDAHRPRAREALVVTEGTVTLCVGTAEPVPVRRGQSALFRADEPHSYRNDTKRMARFVLAVHDPNSGPV